MSAVDAGAYLYSLKGLPTLKPDQYSQNAAGLIITARPAPIS